MRQRIFLSIVLMALFFAFKNDIYAVEKHFSGEREMEEKTLDMDKKLNLTKEQREKLWNIRNKYYNDIQRLRHEIIQKKLELKNLYLDSKANESAIINKQKELMELRQKLEEKSMEMMLEERRVLTPQQLETINRLPMEKRYDRMGPGRGKDRRGMEHPRF